MDSPSCMSGLESVFSPSPPPSTRRTSLSDHVDSHRDDDIAIVGMACRTAGGNDTPEKLWDFLMNKQDASGESPEWRWEPYYRRDPRNAKIMEKTIKKGYFINDLEKFDASFFGISPKEAEQMDPHQRLGLEVTWQALENAGIDPRSLAGSDTAVYMGVDSDDYSRLLLEDLPNIEAWMGIGTTAHGVPNRISYHLDLMGPSAATDAACASSLVAVHSGAHAVRSGESRVAIVGGVNVCISPAMFHMLGAAGALSPDGVCQSFDDDAHGYARGEGAAVLIMKKLSQAIADGDHVLAVLKGIAVAQDGKTDGIFAPNSKAQERVARLALKQSGIDPRSVDFIEAHATSTALGDPTEIVAMSKVYGTGRPVGSPALIGSIKPNVGHLEAAAGAISLVKAIMALNEGVVPPQARLNKLNTRIDWETSGLQVVREAMKWPSSHGPRRAAVCSYGYGGTVAHAIIERPQLPNHVVEELQISGETLLILSAPQEKRLSIQAAAKAKWISTDGRNEALSSIASTLAQRRTQHDYRAAFVVDSHDEAADALQAFADGKDNDHCNVFGRTFTNHANKDVVWVYSGHGAQWPNMGKQLLLNPVFRQVVSSLDDIVVDALGWSAMQALETGIFEGGEQVQVLTYFMHIGLTEILRAKGIQPQAIIGHSMGEIAAAVAAGVLTAKEGAIIITQRARLYSQVKNRGEMHLLRLPFSKVAKELESRQDICVAIASSPSTCVVSGATEPLVQYVRHLNARGIKTWKVNSDIPFHSPMLNELIQPLKEALLGKIHPRPPEVTLYSTSHVDPRTSASRDVEYWTANMAQPVWLTSAIGAAAADGHRIFLEVSSHSIVAHSINEILEDAHIDDFTVIPTMRKSKPVERCILQSVAQLYVKGANIDFATLFGRQWSRKVPGFQWSQRTFWKQVGSGQAFSDKTHDVDMHNLLGQRYAVAGTDTTLFTTKVEDASKPYPCRHAVHDVNITPAAVYVNTFLGASGAGELSEMNLRVPLALTEISRDVQVVVQGDTVKVASRLGTSDSKNQARGNSWVTHCDAHWTATPLVTDTGRISIDRTKNRIGTLRPQTYSIDHLARVGVGGMAFPWSVLEHYGNSSEMIAKVDNDPSAAQVSWNAASWAPCFDAATSIGSTVFAKDSELRIVSKISRMQLFSSSPPPKVYYIHAVETDDSVYERDTRSADVSVLSLEGELLARFHGLRLTEVNATQKRPSNIANLVHQLAWVPARLSEHAVLPSAAVLISSDEEKLDQYRRELGRQIPHVACCRSSQALKDEQIATILDEHKEAAIIFVPGRVSDVEDIAPATHTFICEAAEAIKFLVRNKRSSKLFIVCDAVFAADSPTALAQGALYGLARVAACEHTDIWGGLIDSDSERFPFLPFKYVHGQDVIRYVDGVPRTARFRSFRKTQRIPVDSAKTLLPKPEGTYVISGGLGALGQATSQFLVDKGARRILILSRRSLPSRRQWSSITAGPMADVLTHIRDLEKRGATIHVEPVDVSISGAHERILDILDRLALPPVLGVIHASGILEDHFLMDTSPGSFERVLAPKVAGALALHRAFPPGSVDFFVMYSSVGQLIGIPGQSSYGSGNAFLDTLAALRRKAGDNTIAFQFTSWRGLGMGVPSDFIENELHSKGISDMSPYEGFRAWEYISDYDTDHAVVTPVLSFDEGEPVPCPLVEEVAFRRPRATPPNSGQSTPVPSADRPTSTPELKEWLSVKVREAIASTTQIGDIGDIDPHVALSNIGVDSVMAIALRGKLQKSLKIKIPQTFTWNYPSVVAMVEWFVGQLQSD